MTKKIGDIVTLFFILCVGFLAFISVLSIWKIIDGDVMFKSLATVGIVAFASIIVMFASKSMSTNTVQNEDQNSLVPIFTGVRYVTSGLLIICITLLAIIGVMAIWEVIKDKEVLNRVIGSMLVLAISSLIIIVACADRESKSIFGNHVEGEPIQISVGKIILLVLVGAWILGIFL